ncbi:MAG: hypothetical protein DMG05_16900 [Acidobacteria bacterium]|nr:MAG: hypothetical protein DMG05_16900 [Acidobacteriota bacterium]
MYRMYRLVAFMFLIVLCLPETGLAWSLNPTLFNLPANTALDLGTYTCKGPAGGSIPCGSITDYSGFVYDKNNHQMLMFGGGHAASFRDDVDVFNFDSLKWNPAYTPTPCSQMTVGVTSGGTDPDNRDLTNGTWKSTTHPISRHSYDMLVVTENTKELIVLNGFSDVGDCSEKMTGMRDISISHYDPIGKKWSFSRAATGGWPNYASSEYDPLSGMVIVLDSDSLWTYDPVSQVKTLRLTINQKDMGYANNLIYYPPNQKMYYIARGTPTRVWEVTLNRTSWASSSVKEVTGITGNIPSSQESSFAYDSVNQIIGGGIKNGVFYAYNPLNKTWASKVMQAQTSSVGTLAFHALAYDPVDNIFLFITGQPSTGWKTWAYRYAPAGETSTDSTAPTAPTNLGVNVVSSSQIDLSWSASTDNVGVAGYVIYRNGVQIKTATQTDYSDTNLSSATSYSYSVSSYDAAGNISSQSTSVNAISLAATCTADEVYRSSIYSYYLTRALARRSRRCKQDQRTRQFWHPS